MIDDHIIDFIQDHAEGDPDLLVLQKDKYPGIPMAFVALQISLRQKLKAKFPFLLSKKDFLFPSKLSYEQSSSEATAIYKSSLFTGNEMADLTGGLGMDAYFFSKTFRKVYYIEREEELSQTAQHNFQVLDAGNIEVHHKAAEQFLGECKNLDLIYLDPDRRDELSRKVFRIEDCDPNVIEIYPALVDKAEKVLWKASPLLDIKSVLKQIPGIFRVDVVSVGNEVKELLFLLKSGYEEKAEIHCIDLEKKYSFQFNYNEEQEAESVYSEPLAYIYEPNSSILKAGAFKSTGHRFGLKKIAPHSHLYTSSKQVADFPGRVFRLIQIVKPSAKEVKKYVPDLKANLSSRNFPMKIEDLRRKLKLKDGGDLYLFATQDVNANKILLLTEKP